MPYALSPPGIGTCYDILLEHTSLAVRSLRAFFSLNIGSFRKLLLLQTMEYLLL